MWEYWERRGVPAKQKKTSSNDKIKSQKSRVKKLFFSVCTCMVFACILIYFSV